MIGLPDGINALLFDLDGVLTPTAVVHAAAWGDLFDDFLRHREGDTFTPFDRVKEYDDLVDGKPRVDGVRAFLAARHIELPDGSPDDGPDADTVAGLAARKDRLFLAKVERDGVRPYPGSVAYLTAARAVGKRTAVVSSSRNCRQIVTAAGLADYLDVRVDGRTSDQESLRGKPEPDTFLAAARLLGADPAQAAVFEDATAGVSAGRAGAFGYVVGVDRVDHDGEDEHADALREHGADVVVTDLAELLDDKSPAAGGGSPAGNRTVGR
jgi:beta-phosphoglucomutase family hydrolase